MPEVEERYIISVLRTGRETSVKVNATFSKLKNVGTFPTPTEKRIENILHEISLS